MRNLVKNIRNLVLSVFRAGRYDGDVPKEMTAKKSSLYLII